jgi:HSP20 family protein
MGLVRWSPWQGLFDIERDLDQLMRRPFGASTPWSDRREGTATTWVPAVDVFTRDKDLVVRAELPGIDPEKDVDISFQDGVLTIRGERRYENRDEGVGMIRIESSYGSFQRSVMLPDGVREKDIHANYENGILEVVVPKAGELSSPKKIPVKVASGRRAVTTEGGKRD